MPAKPISSPPELTVAAVAELHARLRAAVTGGEHASLDLAEVRRLDASGAQLLLSAVRSGVLLLKPSEAVVASVEDLGLTEALDEAGGFTR